MAKKQKRTNHTTRAATPTRKRPKAQALPGMEDRKIPALEECGAEYAEIRDARMELTEREHALKTHVRVLMKKHNRTHYKSNQWDITLIPTEDDVKVKRVKDDELDTDDDEDIKPTESDNPDDEIAEAEAEIQQTEERRRAVDGDEANDTGE